MKRKGVWNPVLLPGLVVAGWLVVFFLLGGSTIGAMPSKGAAVPGTPTTAEAAIPAAETSAPSDGLLPCRGVWVTRSVDVAGDVGRATSLALAPSHPYTPQISYHDVTSASLKYAWLSGTTWLSETVDPTGGQFTSLQLVPLTPYTPCIAYLDYDFWALKFACKDGSGWPVSLINTGQRAGQRGTPLAFEPTYPYTPHISYFNPSGIARNLHHAYLSGTVWVEEWVEPPLSERGWWSSLALEPAHPYTPHISYYDVDNQDLKHAWLGAVTWLSKTVDYEGDVGWWTSLALDSGGNPHISYYDHTNDSLKYARSDGTAWLIHEVDSIGRSIYSNAGTSLALDEADIPHICYYDAINRDLKHAFLDGATWISETVDGAGDVGAYCSLALDAQGCPHISYYDATHGDLRYAILSPVKVYLPLVMRNHPPLLPYYHQSPEQKANCAWTGVWGTVLTAGGLPEAYVQLRVGNLQGWRADAWSDANGNYGYMFADYAMAGRWFVQVFKGGQPASEPLWWDTTATCTGEAAVQELRVGWRER